MNSEVKVGPQVNGDGALVTARGSKNGAMVVGQEHGPYYEAAARGVVFTTSNAAVGVAIAATDVSPVTAGTGTGIVVVGNPLNSGKNLVILKAGLSQVSGTPGGGVVWNYIPNINNVTAAQVGTINSNVVGGGAASVARVWNHTALTGSTLGVMFRPLFSQSAIALGVSGAAAELTVDGDIVVPPGVGIAIAATATGTSHTVCCSITWEEVPL